MKIRPITWITISYKDHPFDVKWSERDQQIKEIRSVDSEINIASLLSLKVKREIQDMIINKRMHHAI
jgi:hypothetical protein